MGGGNRSTEIHFCGLQTWQDRKEEGRRQGKQMGNGFAVPTSENGFSKYSGVVVPAGRNRPRFAIQAHCGLLVTSMSPNCCLLNGILRKSHFLRRATAKPFPICFPCRRPSFFLSCHVCNPQKWIPEKSQILTFSFFYICGIMNCADALRFGADEKVAKEDHLYYERDYIGGGKRDEALSADKSDFKADYAGV